MVSCAGRPPAREPGAGRGWPGRARARGGERLEQMWGLKREGGRAPGGLGSGRGWQGGGPSAPWRGALGSGAGAGVWVWAPSGV